MQLFCKTYRLSLARNYVSSWGVVQAVREFIQNALDSDSPFEYEWDTEDDGSHTLSLISRHSTLRPEQLLLGGGTKANDESKIGSFGEGFKLALLVLTREGKPTIIHNNGKSWHPTFREDKSFGAETLAIEEVTSDHKRGVNVLISGLTQDEREKIVMSCLLMQETIGETITVPQGRILLHAPGALYVGGLFICKTELKHGYDVHPKHIRLERDRQTVDSFDLKWLVKDMWFAANRPDDVARMISEEVPDVQYAEHGAPQLVKEACYKVFKEAHPGAVVAKTQDELRTMVEQKMSKPVYVGQTMGALVQASASYRKDVSRVRVLPATPHERLKAWFKEAKYHMHVDAAKTFKGLLDESKRWELK